MAPRVSNLEVLVPVKGVVGHLKVVGVAGWVVAMVVGVADYEVANLEGVADLEIQLADALDDTNES